MIRDIPVFLHQKIESEYIIWLKKSNRFVHLQEPAWRVIRLVKGKKTDDAIRKKISLEYGMTTTEAERFIENILSELIAFDQITNEPEAETCDITAAETFNPEIFSEMSYIIGTKRFNVKYQTQRYEYFIHPLFSHFQTKKPKQKVPLELELFEYNQRIFLRKNGKIAGGWALNESHLVKGQVFLDILELLHNKKENKWLAALHASAISDTKSTILFSAQAGSGKTTISSLLRASGLRLISDDFVPIDGITGLVFPFPTAVSVKEGSIPVLSPYYPSLLAAETIRYEALNKTVRFAPPENYELIKNLKLPVKALVFVTYDPSHSVHFEKADTITAFNAITAEAWIPPKSRNIQSFLKWFEKIPCYIMKYSDNDLAISKIKQLFENDQ